MKRTLGILSLAFLTTVAPAFADDATTQPARPAPPTAAQRAAMEQVHAQMKQLQLQERSQILGSLSPAHRTMLANVIGQLAISPNPDPATAAAAIDKSLSQAEGNNVLRIHDTFRTQHKALMDNARAQFESTLTADQRAKMESRRTAMDARMQQQTAARRAEDPGHLLLMLAASPFERGHGPGGMMGGPRGPGAPDGPPPAEGMPH